MSDLTELYQAVILDHNRKPRNHGQPERFDGTADGRNTLCGDALTVWVALDGDTLADVRFVGEGCAISKASASLMTQAVKGKSREEAAALFQQFHKLVHGESAAEKSLGELRAMAGVSRFPARMRCALLAWGALHEVLGRRK